ncbi:hypothetical protein D623_10014956 [Myotis brandtii]|uniref:Uncharacterized protein n=1 Tax=Myotis brandtii TaxID=109478 RepID=S7PX87_MYOBR|nr:hypothetical protein D623_10014956 [Myotis brandtii]
MGPSHSDPLSAILFSTAPATLNTRLASPPYEVPLIFRSLWNECWCGGDRVCLAPDASPGPGQRPEAGSRGLCKPSRVSEHHGAIFDATANTDFPHLTGLAEDLGNPQGLGILAAPPPA